MPDPQTTDRRQRGRHAEDAAEALLRSSGHRVLARNLRLGHLEVDLVTFDPGGSLVLTEVKARAGHRHAPELRVDLRKRRHLVRAAALLLARPAFRGRAARFDVVSVELSTEGRVLDVRHLPRAFTADDT